MDLAPLEEAAVTAAAAIVSACGVVIASYIRAHVKNQAAQNLLIRADNIGAGLAHDAMTTAVANGTAPDWAAAKSKFIAEATVEAQKIAAGVTTESITAALAPLLAADPSVPAGPASTATATAPAGGTAAAIAEPPALPPGIVTVKVGDGGWTGVGGSASSLAGPTPSPAGIVSVQGGAGGWAGSGGGNAPVVTDMKPL